ncbi:uncharacterized protein LOC143085121 [Mytilus galloprovincialis]|uniref:uncharacterized protein LOC143085121 n=1 Tax=Mytilus galloprovincialis TaxID=29158 RepID=UPI003F7C85B0
MTSRLHIFLSVNLQKPTFCHLNLTSNDLVLSLEERKRIGRCYLHDDIIDGIGQEVIMSTSFFPALCSSVRAENKEHIIEYFKLPVEYISSETINMRKYGDVFFFALTILLIFDNKVKKDLFNEGSHQYDEMLQFLSKEIGFDTQPLKSLLFSRFIALKKSYVLENTEYFECLHINLFNALVLSIGPCIMRTLIIYGESSFLNKRTCPETSNGTYPKLKIVIPKELQDMHFERMLSDVILGKYDLFEGDQHSSVEFRKSFIAHLKKYLNKGDLKKGSHGTKVLHVVSAKGFSDYVEFFLGLKNTLGHLKDNDGQTALHKACMHGNTHVANILLDNGASIDLTDNNNETALYIACKNNKSVTVEYLLSRGATINARTGDLKFPLHVACLNGNTEIAKCLIENKAKVNVKDSNKNTPLHLACANGRAKVVNLLARYKLDINLVDFESKTAMYIAAEQGNTNIVRCLIGLSPDLNITTDKGRVALHCASEYGFEEIAKLLIEHEKANINIADMNGVTPLYVACEKGQLKIVKLLLDNNAIVDIPNALKSTPLFIACENGNTEIVRLLLQRQADANFKNSDQMTPLHKACGSNQTDIVSLLINYGASVNKPDKDLQTPLIISCLKGNYKVVDALLKVGASVNYANITGLTPLHEACMREQKEIVQLLLDYDADIQKEATNGLTPLAMACKSGNKCIEDALLMKLHDKQKNTSSFIIKARKI